MAEINFKTSLLSVLDPDRNAGTALVRYLVVTLVSMVCIELARWVLNIGAPR